MLSLFQILNKIKNSRKILKVKKCENVDFIHGLILQVNSKKEANNIFPKQQVQHIPLSLCAVIAKGIY